MMKNPNPTTCPCPTRGGRRLSEAQLQGRKIQGKGWAVYKKPRPSRYVWQALACGRYVGEMSCIKDAVQLAVNSAFFFGGLDWDKSQRWCDIMGVDGIVEPTAGVTIVPFSCGKGWYVYRKEVVGRPVVWCVEFGQSKKLSVYACSRSTKVMAIRHALAVRGRWYDAGMTKRWLDMNGFGWMMQTAEKVPFF
jgi:hypothetical protein